MPGARKKIIETFTEDELNANITDYRAVVENDGGFDEGNTNDVDECKLTETMETADESVMQPPIASAQPETKESESSSTISGETITDANGFEEGEIDEDESVEDEVPSGISNVDVPILSQSNIEKIDWTTDSSSSPTGSPTLAATGTGQSVNDSDVMSFKNTNALKIDNDKMTRKRTKPKKEEKKKKERQKENRFCKSPKQPTSFLKLLMDYDDMDEFEMMNVRGGSPTTKQPSPPPFMYPPPSTYEYDSDEYFYDTYDSFNSMDSAGGSQRRRRDQRIRERRDRCVNKRKATEEKRSREPRKMEICKFYLQDSCMKKGQCSYMHSDFPCKFYYLGIECEDKDSCKFMHGKPLNEKLRRVLLRHLGIAPKEILGNFERITRQSAVVMMARRNEELCKEYNVQNTWMKRANAEEEIPSLLDIVVNPPTTNDSDDSGGAKMDATNDDEIGPNYLDLSNLGGIMNKELFEKLTKIGINNLIQVNQLTFGQLREIDVDFDEITKVKTKAKERADGESKPTAKKIKNDFPNTDPECDATIFSCWNGDTSIAVPRVDYTDYLNDSNFSFEHIDTYDDDGDNEQLVIDDDGLVSDEKPHLPKNDGYSPTLPQHSLSPSCTLTLPSSRPRSRSRSRTPTSSRSPTPEAPQSPEELIIESPPSIYDFDAGQVEEDKNSLPLKSDETNKDKGSSNYADVLGHKYPFEALINYTPATEIDCTNLPLKPYKLIDLDVPTFCYDSLRRSLSSYKKTSDPRVRRLFGLPETSAPIADSSTVGNLENIIRSPDSNGIVLDPRRRAATASTTDSSPIKDTRCSQEIVPNEKALSEVASSSICITDIMQRSLWYRNLNYNEKTMVNQQLAHLKNELKKFHHNTTGTRLFNPNIILKNNTLAEILKKLGIFINPNGEVKQHECNTNTSSSNTLPNHLPPQQLQFLNQNTPPRRPALLGESPYSPYSGSVPQLGTMTAYFDASGLMESWPGAGLRPFAGIARRGYNRKRRGIYNRRNFI